MKNSVFALMMISFFMHVTVINASEFRLDDFGYNTQQPTNNNQQLTPRNLENDEELDCCTELAAACERLATSIGWGVMLVGSVWVARNIHEQVGKEQ